MRQLPVLRSIPAASCAALPVACLHYEGPTTTGPLFATTTIAPLYYARCETGRTSAASWQTTLVDPDPLFDAVPVVALAEGGHPRSG